MVMEIQNAVEEQQIILPLCHDNLTSNEREWILAVDQIWRQQTWICEKHHYRISGTYGLPDPRSLQPAFPRGHCRDFHSTSVCLMTWAPDSTLISHSAVQLCTQKDLQRQNSFCPLPPPLPDVNWYVADSLKSHLDPALSPAQPNSRHSAQPCLKSFKKPSTSFSWGETCLRYIMKKKRIPENRSKGTFICCRPSEMRMGALCSFLPGEIFVQKPLSIVRLPSGGVAQIFTPSALFPHIQSDTQWNQLCSLSIYK
ncbi:uncharacterized protein LOC122203135 [Panthera leo]|uniref:uncharacterized protein LOC122203135 n=1 Tax=Panthera leo TaxID=9689 RepID=UPI001C69B69E|nr:uncharacterized protein LOC122203135 [Panthera leo]